MAIATPVRLDQESAQVEAVCTSIQGLLAVGMTRPRENQNEISFWDLDSAECIRRIPTDFNGILSLAFSPNGQLLASGGGSRSTVKGQHKYTNGIEVWQLQDFRRVAKFGDDLFFVKAVSFSHDGNLLLSTNYQPPANLRPERPIAGARIWRAADFKQLAGFAETGEPIRCARFSSADRFVVFAHAHAPTPGVNFTRDEIRSLRPWQIGTAVRESRKVHNEDANLDLVRTWNVRDRCEDIPFGIHTGSISALALSPEDKLLAVSGTVLTLWDFAQRRQVAELVDRSNPFTFTHCVAFSPDGTTLAAGTGDHSQFGDPWQNSGVKLWDVRTRSLIVHLEHKGPVYSVAFSQDGRKLIAGGESDLLVWTLDCNAHGKLQG